MKKIIIIIDGLDFQRVIDGDVLCRGGNTDYELYVGFISPPAANAETLRNARTQVLYDASKKGKKADTGFVEGLCFAVITPPCRPPFHALIHHIRRP